MATSPIILILGAGENVGFHVASSFAKNGYKVAVASRSEKSAVDAADLYVKADFSDPESIKGVFEQVKEKLGAPSVVVYNGMLSDDPLTFCILAA
jgi:NAD(P)-dependent dehydrogenase (short-subunit alcohol dehydrogenase family)